MRKAIALFLLALCLLPAAALGENVTFMGQLTVSADVQSVDLGDIVVKDYDQLFAFLDRLPNLKRLDMFATPIRRAQVEALEARYPGVEFGWTLKIDEHLVRTDATAFSTLHNKKSKQHTTEQLSLLTRCKNLQALDIGHNNVDDISWLAELPNLKVLIIALNHNIKDISVLSKLTQLEYLEMFHLQVTDISPLANLTNLLDLNISFNYIEDFTPLYGLKKLERLWMFNSNNYNAKKPVPDDVIASIKANIPGVYIDNKYYPTNGGWREHPRYFVIAAMFKQGVYIPFTMSDYYYQQAMQSKK